MFTRSWLKVGKMAAASAMGGLLTNYIVAKFLDVTPALILACVTFFMMFHALDVVTGPRHADSPRWRWLTRWFTRSVAEKREALMEVADRHLQRARTRAFAAVPAPFTFIEWASSFRADAKKTLNAIGWSVLQAQLDIGLDVGREFGDRGAFENAIQFIPPLVATIPPDGFRD